MLMLIDKGFYDYDFKVVEKVVDAKDTVLSDDKLQNMMQKFGFGSKKPSPKDMNMDELQQYAMNQN